MTTRIRAFFTLAALAILATTLNPVAAGAEPPPECHGRAVTIAGTPGDDVITGTDGDDVIAGLGGDDTIRAGAGDDIVCGGPGSDTIYGESGNDWLSGSGGFDEVWGGAGQDRIRDRRARCHGEHTVGCGPWSSSLSGAEPPPTTTTAPPVAEAPVPEKCGNEPQWVFDAINASFSDTPHVCYFAEYISWRESRWTADIIGGPNRNGSYDYGLLQLNSGYIRTWANWAGVSWLDWSDPVINARIARALYDRAGEIWGDPLRPWRVR